VVVDVEDGWDFSCGVGGLVFFVVCRCYVYDVSVVVCGYVFGGDYLEGVLCFEFFGVGEEVEQWCVVVIDELRFFEL